MVINLLENLKYLERFLLIVSSMAQSYCAIKRKSSYHYDRPRRTTVEEAAPATRLKNAVVSSRQYSDHLYHFSKEPARIVNALKHKGFTLNYVIEDFAFLDAKGLDTMAFPMICFCDIKEEAERLEPHRELYGHYGIGLTKDWGRNHGVQPVHYILPGSPFAQDFKQATEAAFSLDFPTMQDDLIVLSDFLITSMAYAKPLWGTNNGTSYCFEDECEWRFIPADLASDLPRLIPHPVEDAHLDNFRHTIWRPETYLLEFTYEDVSAIFVEKGHASELSIAIEALDASQDEKAMLKTKIRED